MSGLTSYRLTRAMEDGTVVDFRPPLEVTWREIVDDFRDLGVIPITGDWLRPTSFEEDAKKCGCACGVLVLAFQPDLYEKTGELIEGSDQEVGEVLGWHVGLVDALSRGWEQSGEWAELDYSPNNPFYEDPYAEDYDEEDREDRDFQIALCSVVGINDEQEFERVCRHLHRQGFIAYVHMHPELYSPEEIELSEWNPENQEVFGRLRHAPNSVVISQYTE